MLIILNFRELNRKSIFNLRFKLSFVIMNIQNRFLVVLMFFWTGFFSFGQQPHDHPDHPKGNNSNDQYEALPFYNEACELYEKGQVKKAKRSLYEAINTSFALTEAQLFLGKIFLDEQQYDSAFLYLNSGIDFATEQAPHHYFYMLEAGMRVGQYDKMKHNLKHFKKLYGSVDGGAYEQNYPYTVTDYEFYLDAMNIVFDINNWEPKGELVDTLLSESLASVVVIGNTEEDILVLEEGHLKMITKESCYKNSKDIKGAEAIVFKYAVLSSEENYIFYASGKEVGVGKVEGGKWKTQCSLPSFGLSSNPEYLYFCEEEGLLYFSAAQNGNLDLFVVEYDLERNQFVGEVLPLERINTLGDETSIVFKNGVFYFSSNGHPGFGGFDIFYTPHYNTINGIITPSDWMNIGKPYNSPSDEVVLLIGDDYSFLLRDIGWNEPNEILNLIYQPYGTKKAFDYNIKMINLSNGDD